MGTLWLKKCLIWSYDSFLFSWILDGEDSKYVTICSGHKTGEKRFFFFPCLKSKHLGEKELFSRCHFCMLLQANSAMGFDNPPESLYK